MRISPEPETLELAHDRLYDLGYDAATTDRELHLLNAAIDEHFSAVETEQRMYDHSRALYVLDGIFADLARYGEDNNDPELQGYADIDLETAHRLATNAAAEVSPKHHDLFVATLVGLYALRRIDALGMQDLADDIPMGVGLGFLELHFASDYDKATNQLMQCEVSAALVRLVVGAAREDVMPRYKM